MKTKKRKEYIKKFIEEHKGEQVFFTRNLAGDSLEVKVEFEGIIFEYCNNHGYWEIFGLTKDEKNLFTLDCLNIIAGDKLIGEKESK